MAKKGGAQQLQADIQTDEDLFKFIDRPGLIVLDIYSEWCGPCLAMVNSLRKIKLELGGDNLSLAICKSDTIEVLSRFRGKSEPTWMFVTKGKAVKLLFGSDVPVLMQTIANELALLQTTKRAFYALDELHPEERARRDVVENALAEARRKEIEEAERARLEYLNHVTDEIISNLPDNGVSIFGPQVTRDYIKKIMEIGDHHKIQCKDRRTMLLTKEQFDIVNFACENPLETEVLEQLYNKELLVCFWKVASPDRKPLEDVLWQFAADLTTPKPREDNTEAEGTGALLQPLEIRIYPEVEKVEERPTAAESEPVIGDPLNDIMNIGPPEANAEEEEEEAEEGAEKADLVSEVPSDVQIIVIPPIWVPKDRRTHATLIYVFFRPQTMQFLPPDPVPDPPHIIMAFDAYKKKDIFDTISKNKENVLLYGFFTNDNPEKAELIAKTLEDYEKKSPQVTDKIILKVAKKTSHTMLSFATFGPTYISANTVVGHDEALQFFPEDYVEKPKEEEQVVPKKSKSKIKVETTEGAGTTPTP